MSGPRPVHLVGSVPLRDNTEVFETVAKHLGPLARRIPDGETGNRIIWIRCQIDLLESTPNLRDTVNDDRSKGLMRNTHFEVVDKSKPVVFPPLGYAAAAKNSYAEFSRLKAAGKIPAESRFQVSLPTPLAVLAPMLDIGDQEAVEPAYERRMTQEVEEILAAVPHKELAIQWDVCIEILLMEGVALPWWNKDGERMLAKTAALIDLAPADVDVGIHICYGDLGNKHWVEPKDLALSVLWANEMTRRTKRPMHWVHMASPIEREDDAFFAPLGDLKLKPETDVFVGVVNSTDGLEGSKRRLDAARRARPDVGVATECGFGRRPPETIPGLLDLHKALAEMP